MKINIYDNNLKLTAILEDRYYSCLWAEGFNSAQKFTLELANTQAIKDRVKVGYYAKRTDRDTLMKIDEIQTNRERIIASGQQGTICLEDVAMIDTFPAGSAVDTKIIELYGKSHKFRGLEFKNTNLGVRYPQQIAEKSFLYVCETLCQATDLGIKVVKKGNTLEAEFYRPATVKKTFSEDFGNVEVKEIHSKDADFKNYAIVLGQGRKEERIRVDVDITSGEPRKELIVDARDIQQEEKETLTDYKKRLTARGVEKLLEKTKIFNISFNIIGKDFGKDFDLGDMIELRLRNYGLTFTARIIRFSQKAQNNTLETTVEIGSIQRRK